MRLGLLGFPIAKSLSPVMQRAALAARGIAGSYELFEAADEAAAAGVWQALERGEIDGLNVTIPWKGFAAAHVACAPEAARLGAINTVVKKGGALIGHNSDVPGLAAAVREAWPELPRGAALIVGAGGAASAALVVAEVLGFSDVRVWNRTPERAAALVARLGSGRAVADVAEAARGTTLVLQASSHGMGLEGEALAGAEREARDVLVHTDAAARVVDLVYRPRHTAWVRAAESLGRQAIDGLPMLVHQAALAFELWTQVRAAADAQACADGELVRLMRVAASEALVRTS